MFQPVGGNGFVDQAPFGGPLPRDVLAGLRVVHRAAKPGEFRDDLASAAAGQDSPVDLRQTELRVFGGNGEVATEERAVCATEAPSVDHRDGRLLVPAQPLPPI